MKRFDWTRFDAEVDALTELLPTISARHPLERLNDEERLAASAIVALQEGLTHITPVGSFGRQLVSDLWEVTPAYSKDVWSARSGLASLKHWPAIALRFIALQPHVRGNLRELEATAGRVEGAVAVRPGTTPAPNMKHQQRSAPSRPQVTNRGGVIEVDVADGETKVAQLHTSTPKRRAVQQYEEDGWGFSSSADPAAKSHPQPRQMLGWRAIHTTTAPGPTVSEALFVQLSQWLSDKGLSADFSPGFRDLAPWAHLNVVELRSNTTGARVATRIEFSEYGEGIWTVRITLAELGKTVVLWTDVDAPARPSRDRVDVLEPVYSKAPRFLNQLLNVLPISDGEGLLRPAPTVIDGERVDELLDVLCDTTRRSPVFVAGPAIGDQADWLDLVSRMTSDVRGVSQTYVLTTEALEAFTEGITRPFSVEPGTLRTYQSGVDPALPHTSPLHRVLSRARIASDEVWRIARILGSQARMQMQREALPQPLQRLDIELSRLAAAARLKARPGALEPKPSNWTPPRPRPTASQRPAASPPGFTVPTPAALKKPPARHVEAFEPPTTDPRQKAEGQVRTDESRSASSWILERVKSIVNGLFGRTEIDEAVLDELELHALAGVIASDELNTPMRGVSEQAELERQKAELYLEAYEDEQLDHAETAARLREAEERLRRFENLWFQEERAGDVAAVYEVVTETPPSDAWELLSRMRKSEVAPLLQGQLQRVIFTGDAREVEELQDGNAIGLWIQRAWDALQVLDDYAAHKAAKTFSGSVHDFCANTPAGSHTWSANRHSAKESESTWNDGKLRAQRTLPVPVSVSADGQVYMESHFKLAQNRSVSPRLHYFDDTMGTGFIYVGYLGRHLDLISTN